MIRALRLLWMFAIFSGLAALALMGWQALGGVQYDLSVISGQAILAAEQRSTIEDVATIYPPLPMLLTLPFAWVPGLGSVAASAAAVLLFGMLGAALYYSFRTEAIRRGTAFLLACLIILSPLAVQALAAGPGPVLLLIGMTMLAFGVFGMTGEAAAPDVMLTALALCVIAFAHPFGLVLVLACLPCLAVAAPPAMVARAPIGMFLVLFFPVCFALASFAYTRWAMAVDPIAFVQDAIGPAPFGETDQPATPESFLPQLLASVLAAAPLIAVFILWSIGRASHLRAAGALLGMLLLAGILQAIFHGRTDPPLILALSLPIAAVCAVQAARERPGLVVLLLFAGCAGSFMLASLPPIASGQTGPEASASARRAPGKPSSTKPSPANASPAKPSLEGLALNICPRKDVLVDTRAHPRLAQLCGTAKSFVGAGDAEFDIQIQSRRLTSPYVLVGAPHIAERFDILAHTFPDFYQHGADGYVLIFDQAGWRLYERLPERPVS